MKLTHKLLLLTGASLLQGCVTNPVNSLSGLMPGSFDDSKTYLVQVEKVHTQALNSTGAEADRFRVQSEGLGLVDYPDLEAHINSHLDRLKQGSGITQLEGRAYLSAELGFNARTSADGNIYIPIEMLRDLESDDELAALLAHELAHAILNHTDSDMLVSLQKKIVYISSLTANIKSTDVNSNMLDKRRVRNTLGMMLVSDGFLNPGWSRGQELDADKLGMDLLVAGKYTPEAMTALLRKLKAWDEKNAKLLTEKETLRKELLSKAQAEAGADFEKQIELVLNEAGQGLKELLSSFSNSHPDIETRIESLRTYTLKHHRKVPRPPAQKQAWQRLISAQQSQALIQSVTQVHAAQRLFAENHLTEARQMTLQALNTFSTNQNYMRVMMANIRDAQGHRDKVKANAKLGLQGRYPAYKLHYYDAILGVNDRSKLATKLTQLTDVFDSYGKPPLHYVDLITLADATGNRPLKSKLEIECRISYAGEAVACAPNEQAASQELSYNRMVDMLL